MALSALQLLLGSVIQAYSTVVEYKCYCVLMHTYMLTVKYQVYLTVKSVVDPPYFFANQFGHRVAGVVRESLHKVLHRGDKEKNKG